MGRSFELSTAVLPLGDTLANQSLQTDGNALLTTISTPIATISATPLMRVAVFDDSDTQVTAFEGGTQYATNVAYADGNTGTMSLAVRDDELTTLTPADGDFVPQRVDSMGAAYSNQGNRISTTSFNSRDAATLAAAATFQGTGEDVSRYGRVGVSIVSDNATDGVLTMEVSRDNVTWGGPTRTWADTRFAQPHMWNIVEKYFRIKYVNGTTEATNLAIQVQYSNNADVLLGHQLNETLLDETEAIAVRSVGVGQDPNDTYTNFVQGGVDDDNSSTTNLTSGTSLVFTGTWLDISKYNGISVLVDGTASGTVGGTLQMQFSHDASIVHRNISIANTDITNVNPRTLGVVAKYFRVIYTADSDLLTFVIETMLHLVQVALVSRLDQTLDGTEDVSNVRSAIVGKHAQDDDVYVNIEANQFGALEVEPEQHVVISAMEALTAEGGTWAAIDTDTTGVALSTKHVLGAGAIEFDKVDGLANSGIGGITKALTAIDLGTPSPHDIIQTVVYVGATTELDGGSAYFFIRLGTNSTDYNEWRIDGTEFTAGIWETVVFEVGDASWVGQGGAGIDWGAITYVAVGFSFDAVGDTLANIYVDEISFHTNLHVNAAINAEISSSVSSANINVQKIGGSVVTKGAGNASNGSQRVVLATDDINTAAMVVDLAAIEVTQDALVVDLAAIEVTQNTLAGAVAGTEMQVDIVAALPAGTAAIGKLAANSGVDIGDVDITSIVNDSINGPEANIGPTIDSYTQVAINLTTAADQVLVASAANKQIWVYGYGFTCGTADGQTVSLQDELDVALTGVMLFKQYGGISVPPSGNFSMPIFKLGTDKDLEIDITGGDVDGYLAYAIVSV